MRNWVLVTGTALALCGSGSLSRCAPGSDDPELRAARERERVAQLEAEAAHAGAFYLVADAGASRLTLAHSGVTLQTYSIARMDVGLPPARGGASGAELSGLYHCQAPELHPPAEIRPGEAVPAEPKAAEAEGKPDPSAEEAPPIGRVPIDCDSSLSLRLVSSASFGWLESIRERLSLPGDLPAETRVRIVLPDEDAERLFASLPPKLLFFVSRLPPAPPAAAAAPAAPAVAGGRPRP